MARQAPSCAAVGALKAPVNQRAGRGGEGVERGAWPCPPSCTAPLTTAVQDLDVQVSGLGSGRGAEWVHGTAERESGRVGEALAVPGLPGLDLLRARYVRHTFARHTHEGYRLRRGHRGRRGRRACRDGTDPGRPGHRRHDQPGGAAHRARRASPRAGRTPRSTRPRAGRRHRRRDHDAARHRRASPRPSSRTRTPPGSSPGCTGPRRRATRSPPTACCGSSSPGCCAATAGRCPRARRRAGGRPHRGPRRAAPGGADGRAADPGAAGRTSSAPAPSRCCGPSRRRTACRRTPGSPTRACAGRAGCWTPGRAPAEAAVAVGFTDQPHLNRHFTRIVGRAARGVPAGARKNVQDRRRARRRSVRDVAEQTYHRRASPTNHDETPARTVTEHARRGEPRDGPGPRRSPTRPSSATRSASASPSASPASPSA